MEGEDTVEDGVDGLAMGEGVLDEADVARGGGRVQAETGDWRGVSEGQEERQSTCTQWRRCILPADGGCDTAAAFLTDIRFLLVVEQKQKCIGLVIILVHNTITP